MRYSIATSIVLASALTNASVLHKKADCEAQANACRVAPGANQSFCSAQLANCLGFNPFNNGTATVSSYAPKESCQAAADQCRTKPGANQSTCSAELAACLGYNPYDKAPAYTTEVVNQYTTYCPEATTVVYNQKTYTATKGETLTITNCPCTITKPVVAPTAKPTGPANKEACEATANQCRTKPGANQSLCSAQLADCLGYNPFTNPPAQATQTGAQTAAPAPTGPASTPTVPAGTPKVSQAADGQVTFTGAAPLNKPATGLFAIGLCALAFF
ncbi:hypothetical protein VTL71DRAFT_2025 [Oculimacula yallundae]|uniref:Uncharacterized protein n=1 Tax=Oculimacula yallundae TaxID=86028 RepID=A0ABR4CCW6_9HELO